MAHFGSFAIVQRLEKECHGMTAANGIPGTKGHGHNMFSRTGTRRVYVHKHGHINNEINQTKTASQVHFQATKRTFAEQKSEVHVHAS